MKKILMTLVVMIFSFSLYGIQIFVRLENGRTIILEIEPDETIADLKIKIQQKEDIPVSVQSIRYEWRYLENDTRLADYDIQRDDTLHLKLG